MFWCWMPSFEYLRTHRKNSTPSLEYMRCIPPARNGYRVNSSRMLNRCAVLTVPDDMHGAAEPHLLNSTLIIRWMCYIYIRFRSVFFFQLRMGRFTAPIDYSLLRPNEIVLLHNYKVIYDVSKCETLVDLIMLFG